MKYLILFVIISFFGIPFYSCKKDSDASLQSSIAGKWKIISDTTFLEGNLTYSGRSSNYIGQPDDYYNFTHNSKLYIKKGTEFDTGSYSMPAKNQLSTVIYSLGNIYFKPNGLIRGPYQIIFKGKDSITATLSDLTPEGKEFETLNLTR